MDCSDLNYYADIWLAEVSAVINHRVPHFAGNFLKNENFCFTSRTLFQGMLHSCANCLYIWKPQPSENSGPVQACSQTALRFTLLTRVGITYDVSEVDVANL